MTRTIWLLFLTALLIVPVSIQALAQSPPPGSTGQVLLDRETVRRRAMSLGPGVRPAQVQQQQAQSTQQKVDVPLTYPPRVELDIAQHHYPGGNGSDLTARLWQDLSLGGYGSARMAYAKARFEQSRPALELARRDAIARALGAWIDAREGRDLLLVRQTSMQAAAELLRIAQSRLRAGSVSPAEVALAQSVYGSARAAILDAEGRIVEADSMLRYALSLTPDAALMPVGNLAQSDDRPIDEQQAILIAQSHHPLVLLAQSDVHVAQRSAQLATAAGRPVLGVGVAYTREATGDRMVQGSVSVPLPLVNPAILDIATAQGAAAVASSRVGETRAQIAGEIRRALHERLHAREVRDELWRGAVEPGREALREMTRRYEAGAVDLASTLAARRELLLAEEAFISAAANVHRADIHLEHAVGGPLPRSQTP